MAEFYRQYKDRKLSPPAALRAAKKYLRRVTIQELAEKNWFDIALKNGGAELGGEESRFGAFEYASEVRPFQ